MRQLRSELDMLYSILEEERLQKIKREIELQLVKIGLIKNAGDPNLTKTMKSLEMLLEQQDVVLRIIRMRINEMEKN